MTLILSGNLKNAVLPGGTTLASGKINTQGAADQVISGTTWTDLTGTSITISIVQSVIVAVAVVGFQISGSTDFGQFDIACDGVRAGGTNGLSEFSFTNLEPQAINALFSGLAPGSHTIKLQARMSGATDTMTIRNNLRSGAFLSAFGI